MEVTVGVVGNEIPPSKVIESRCEKSLQLDELLAAYDLHELTSKMADHQADIASKTVGSGDEGTSTSTLGIRERVEKEEEEEQKEGASLENNKIEENGDNMHETELTWDSIGNSMEDRGNSTQEMVQPMEETPDKIAEIPVSILLPIEDRLNQIKIVPEPTVVKVRRHRRKRPPNKSILRPIFSPGKQPLASSTPGTTDSMIQSIPDLFRNMGTQHDLAPRASKPSSHKDLPIFKTNIGVLDQIRQPVLPVFGASIGPPSRLHLPVSETGYICPDCSDRFWLESSFAQHVQRRSVYINFFCNFCSKLLVFYNRCALLGHARIHQERQQPCDVSSATLAALDKDLIPCVQESRNHLPPPSFISEMRENHATVAKRKRNSPVSVKNVPVSVPEISRSVVSHNCSECKQVCQNAAELAVHFGEDREAPPSTDSECTQCHMICASRCSLVAHQRMHAKKAPNVCPECGLKVSNVWQEYKNHVTESCLHHSRMLGFRCPACGILSVNPEHLKTHVISDHKVTLYKCESCPKAFKSVKSFENHRRSVHSNIQPNTNYSWIQQCPLCESVIHQQNLLAKHLEIHFQEIFAAAKYVFRCLECGLLSENKAELSEHLKTSHSTYPSNNEKKSSKNSKKKLKVTAEETPTNVDKLTVYCNHCNRAFRTVLGLNVHRFRSHGIRINDSQIENYSAVETTLDQSFNNGTDKPPITIKFKKKKKSDPGSNYMLETANSHVGTVNGNVVEEDNSKLKCKLCYDMFPDSRALIEHGNLHIQEGFFVCMLCSNLTFTNKIALGRHLEKHALNTVFPTTCLYCQSVLQEKNQAAVHWREEHGLSSFQCPYCDIRYLYHKSLSRHVRESHNGGKKLKKKAEFESSLPETEVLATDEILVMKCDDPNDIEMEEKCEMEVNTSNEEKLVDEEEAQVPEIVREEQNEEEETEELVCAKCEFKSKKRLVFLRHISQHRGEMDEGFQCLECGTCFVVEPSLHKHLKLVHKVKDLECYLKSMKEEEASAMSDLVNAANNNCSEKWEGIDDFDGNLELKCTICHLFFENEQMLKTHSRSHGMAFLQAAASKRTYSSDTSISSPTSTPAKAK